MSLERVQSIYKLTLGHGEKGAVMRAEFNDDGRFRFGKPAISAAIDAVPGAACIDYDSSDDEIWLSLEAENDTPGTHELIEAEIRVLVDGYVAAEREAEERAAVEQAAAAEAEGIVTAGGA